MAQLLFALWFIASVISVCYIIPSGTTNFWQDLRNLLAIVFVMGTSLAGLLVAQSNLGKPVRLSQVPNEVIVYGQKVSFSDKLIYMMVTHEEIFPKPTLISVDYERKLDEALKRGQKAGKGKPFMLKQGKKRKIEDPGNGTLSRYELEYKISLDIPINVPRK